MGYRYFLKENAERLNISGYINYLQDKSLEIMASGSFDNLHTFLKVCREGFIGHDVESVSFEEIPVQDFQTFEVVDIELISTFK